MLLLDMDGPLTDFVQHALALLGFPLDTVIDNVNMEVNLGISNADFRHAIWKAGSEWWRAMPKAAECDQIIELVKRYDKDFIIATDPGPWGEQAMAGKMAWLRSVFGETFNSFMMGPKKYAMSCPGNILIDDFEANCIKFLGKDPKVKVKHPGDVILVPKPWNELNHIVNPVNYIADRLLWLCD